MFAHGSHELRSIYNFARAADHEFKII
jgi:hypothetical protein